MWEPLDITLYNLAGKYQPQYEGDGILVELVDVNPDPSEVGSFLWRYREGDFASAGLLKGGGTGVSVFIFCGTLT